MPTKSAPRGGLRRPLLRCRSAQRSGSGPGLRSRARWGRGRLAGLGGAGCPGEACPGGGPRAGGQGTAGEGRGCHDRAVLLYEYVGKRIVDLQHTEVPDAYRGRGIAKHLAKAALDFVVEEDLKAHLTCWYIQKYVKENPLPQYLERLQP
ncbi:protein NATD1 [Ailuropoda melanoleuca]|uniref:protein NATD1 n=1 Tax=Ailuropoda melanoleuca TaxID=9646 RepID=UPI001494B8C4|nr:protein NATD1 [Ailuropoda melanoleuca]